MNINNCFKTILPNIKHRMKLPRHLQQSELMEDGRSWSSFQTAQTKLLGEFIPPFTTWQEVHLSKQIICQQPVANTREKRESPLLHRERPFPWHGCLRGSWSREGTYGFRTPHLTQSHMRSRSRKVCSELWSQAVMADCFGRGFCEMNDAAAQPSAADDYWLRVIEFTVCASCNTHKTDDLFDNVI